MTMNANLTLIQLISEQTMQNLLPILRLRPARVVHLATPKTAACSAHIVEAARQSQIVVEAANQMLSRMPGIAETFAAVKAAILQCLQAGQTPIVNFTGGTKLMSIGAFSAALNPNHKAISLYVDTEDEVFLDGRTADGLDGLLEGDFSFTPLRRMLTVNAIAVANGRQRVTGGRDWQPYLPLARHLFEFATEESATRQAVHGPQGLCPNGREPRRPADWMALLDKPLALPPVVGDMAVGVGLVCARGSAFHLPDGTRARLDELSRQERFALPDYIPAVKPLQFAIAFLSGGWWEVIVAEAASRSGQFRDLRWSVNIGERGGGFNPEEDIVAVDGVQIAYFSCKRGGAKERLVPSLDELHSRARSIGGHFTRRFLAVFQVPKGQNAANLQKRARELNGIQILTPRDLENLAVFSRRQS